MKGDFSRFTFDPTKHYSSTRMQQGRVQVDADWNEQMDIFNYRVQTETNDFIGSLGAPDACPNSYKISLKDNNLIIGAGRYYVNGLLCENNHEIVFTEQLDYPNTVLPTESGYYLIYLDVWQRQVTAIEDPRIREVALSGADTTTRVRNLAQVKLFYAGETEPVNYNAILNMPAWQTQIAASSGTLTVQLVNAIQLGNQLYRVEIHQSGSPTSATFKWSRENGSVVAGVQKVTVDSTTNQGTIFLDQLQSALPNPFAIGEWVELNNNLLPLQGQSGYLLQITAMLNNNQLQANWPQNLDPTLFTKDNLALVRLWNGDYTKNANGLPLTFGSSISLENGLEIQFGTGNDATFRSGDYWLIPARAITNAIDWPSDKEGNPLAITPQGIYYAYAPLALCQLAEGTWKSPSDWRTLFSPISSFKALKAVEANPAAPNGSVYIDNLGNVGIGTEEKALTSKLEVKGTATIDTIISGSFSSVSAPNKIPVADDLGRIDSNWLGNRWLSPGTVPAIPTPRYYLAGGVVNGLIYVIGGRDNTGGATAVVEAYDDGTGQWCTVSPMLIPRYQLSAEVVDGKIYAMGGVDPNSGDDSWSRVEVYDPKIDQWTKVSPMTSPRYMFASAVVNGKIYTLGGSATDIVEVYDPKIDKWSNVAPMPKGGRRDAVAVAVNDLIYVIGGMTISGPATTTDVYDPKADKWNQITAKPIPTWGYDFAATGVNGKIYVMGGYAGNDNLLMVYDPIIDQWSSGPLMPTERIGLIAKTLNVVSGAIYVIGGIDMGGEILRNNVDVYLPSGVL